jgi:hypothetical protein
MPIKSKAQRRKFAELLVEGKITPEAFERWNREAGGKELPERLHPETKVNAKAKVKVKGKAKSKSLGKAKAATTKKARRAGRPRSQD